MVTLGSEEYCINIIGYSTMVSAYVLFYHTSSYCCFQIGQIVNIFALIVSHILENIMFMNSFIRMFYQHLKALILTIFNTTDWFYMSDNGHN